MNVFCKSCKEPWEFDEMDNDAFLDIFSEEDRNELDISLPYWNLLHEKSAALKTFRETIEAIVELGKGCPSCGFSRNYKKVVASMLRPGDSVINMGKIIKVEPDPPDYSVGIFGGTMDVTFHPSKVEDIEFVESFDWNDEVLIER